MTLPILAYGDPVLRKVGKDIEKDYPELDVLIANMFETMYKASGIGLAAPQIGLPIRLFIVDLEPFSEDDDFTEQEKTVFKEFKKVFINARIIDEQGKSWSFNEGCLSIPDIREDVSRKGTISIRYQDENFVEHTDTYDGIIARVIQHEYDHIEGILFTDKLSSLKRRLLKGKLNSISKGNIDVDYKMRFPVVKRGR